MCGFNNCIEEAGFNVTTDCCYLPVVGDKKFCTSGIPCGEDEGDCDSHEECESELFCGSHNCPDSLGFDLTVDCCYANTANTLISPNYPNYYPNAAAEAWSLTADVGLIINLQVHSFQVNSIV